MVHFLVLLLKGKKKAKKSALEDDSDNDGEPNSYDYNDSFIDDEEIDGEREK